MLVTTFPRVVRNIDFVWGVIIAIKICPRFDLSIAIFDTMRYIVPSLLICLPNVGWWYFYTTSFQSSVLRRLTLQSIINSIYPNCCLATRASSSFNLAFSCYNNKSINQSISQSMTESMNDKRLLILVADCDGILWWWLSVRHHATAAENSKFFSISAILTQTNTVIKVSNCQLCGLCSFSTRACISHWYFSMEWGVHSMKLHVC